MFWGNVMPHACFDHYKTAADTHTYTMFNTPQGHNTSDAVQYQKWINSCRVQNRLMATDFVPQ